MWARVLPVSFRSRTIQVAVDKENASGLRVVAHFADQSKNPALTLAGALPVLTMPRSAPAFPLAV
jgi:hypothetical protein